MFSGISQNIRSHAPSRQPLEESTDAMAVLFAPDNGRIRYPIELDHAPRTGKRLKPVPGVRIVAEDEKRSLVGRHFGDDVVEIALRAHETQAALRAFPRVVHIDQRRDQFGPAVGMDLSICGAALSAYRDHGRARG